MTTDAPDTTRLTRAIEGVGTVEFVQSAARRDYWFLAAGNERRRRLPSVTSILRQTWPKPALLEWYARLGGEAETALELAARRGHNVHRFVEAYMATGELMDPAEFPADHRPYLRAVAAFLFEYDPQPIATERLIVHPEDGYAGRLDLLARVDGKVTLLDWKSNTKGRIYTEAHVQATAYRRADERCGGDPIEQTMLVGVAEAGTFNVVMGLDASNLWAAILAFFGEIKRFEKAVDGA